MQVIHTQGANGVRGVTVEVDQCLKAVLLAAVEQPIDGALAGAGDRVGLAVILEEIVQEIVADDLPAGAALITQCFCNKVNVFFQRSCTVHRFQPVAQASDNIIVQIFFIGDGDDIIFVREEHLIYRLYGLPALVVRICFSFTTAKGHYDKKIKKSRSRHTEIITQCI